MIGFAVFILFLYFFGQSVLSLLFYLYLWQIKEYRPDRFFCHLKTRAGRQQIFNYLNIFKWKGVRRPVSTLKALLISIISFLFLFRSWFVFLKYLPFDFGLRVLITSFLTNLFAFFFVSLGVLIFALPTLFLKKMIILWAKTKIAQLPDLVVIGITGSYGKSSTKEFLATLLSDKFKTLKTPKNWNTAIGVAKVILRQLKKEHQILVVEMGAYKKGEIAAICDLVQPKIGVLTGINAQHLALFGSLEKIMATKYELIESLPADGLAVFNGDNRFCRELAETTKIKKKIYSIREARKVRAYQKKLSFELEKRRYQLSLLGRFQLSNFLAAYWVARALKMRPSQIARAAAKIKPLEGTMKPFNGLNGGFFIDDTYSSNPDGFASALVYLKKQGGKKIVVTPGIIELGQASAKIHRQLGKKLAQAADLVILFKSDAFKIFQESGVNVLFEENPEKILKILKKEVGQDDVVLLEGRLPKVLMQGLK